MAIIDASNKEDLKLLAACFYTTPPEDRWKIVGKLHDLRLMKFRYLWIALWIVEKWKGRAGIYQFFKMLSQKHPKYLDMALEDTIVHIVNGKDKEDPVSAGGWSQREINLLLDNVTFSLLRNKVEKTEENK